MLKNKAIFFVIGLALIIGAIFIIYRWKVPKNDIIEPIEVIKNQPTTQIKINDSIKATTQDVLRAIDKGTITKLLDSIEKITNKYAKLTPTVLVDFKSNQIYRNKIGTYQDSLAIIIDSLIKLKKEKNMLAYENVIKNKTFKFTVKDKWFDEYGNFDLTGKINIDTLQIRSQSYVILGDKGKWYQKKTITALVGDHNPYVYVDSLRTYTYVPKLKTEFSVGPVILTNIKQTSVGVAATFKKGLFSASIGYLLPIKN